MKRTFLSLLVIVPLVLTGCMGKSDSTVMKVKPATAPPGQASHNHDHDHGKPGDKAGDATNATIVAERAKLSAEDRALVDAQEWCAIQNDERLGVMGPPVKIMVKDQPVFLCCGSCKTAALKNEDETLAKVEALKAKKKAGGTAAKAGDAHGHEHHGHATDAEIKATREKLSAEDRALVEAQEWCAIMPDDRLGCMGAPIKLMIKGQPVFLCCKGCEKEARADEDKTLAKAEAMKAKKQAGGTPK